ncbi:MAG: hypothetical protein E5V49_13035 [Mesorhizobium sp.]|nr:MAG: hypothetical protein E5V48_11145 [Mesorhizobium sp.]TJW32248.1 MAG: hypothetical protein E5V49_13035 [Mesorhizobium sp.]
MDCQTASTAPSAQNGPPRRANGESATDRRSPSWLQRAQFGRRSQRLGADQLALAKEDLDGDIAASGSAVPVTKDSRRAAIPSQAADRSSDARGRFARHRRGSLPVLRRPPCDQ